MNQEAINNLQEALSHAGEDPKVLEQLRQLELRRITPDKELPSMDFLFQMFGKPCFPRGELVGISGKPKSGKTFISSILMALCFREEVLTLTRRSAVPLSILWYDTEQSDESTQDILRHRLLPMIQPGGQEGTFNVFNVRQEPWQQRLPLLEVAISQHHPDLVILDGIRDLINDINDGVLAQEVVERLMQLASNQRCCIACILHQNKSIEDKNLRGWIGTELTHKAFEVYECAKDEDCIFSFSQKLTRKYDIVDSLRYVVDEHGIPQLLCTEQLLALQNKQGQSAASLRPELNRKYIACWNGKYPIFNLKLLFADALPEEGRNYTAEEVQQTVKRISNITSSGFYDKLRERALSEGIILMDQDERQHVFYHRNPPGDAPF